MSCLRHFFPLCFGYNGFDIVYRLAHSIHFEASTVLAKFLEVLGTVTRGSWTNTLGSLAQFLEVRGTVTQNLGTVTQSPEVSAQ